jgi:hypothetical protein
MPSPAKGVPDSLPLGSRLQTDRGPFLPALNADLP